MSCAFANVAHREPTDQRAVTMQKVRELAEKLKSSVDEPVVLTRTCDEIRQLASSHPDNSSKIGPRGVEAIVKTCLAPHLDHASVVASACGALGALASGNFINKKRMSSQPVVKLVAAAMRQHPTNATVQLHAMKAIQQIAQSNSRNAARAVHHGVHTLVWAAMTMSPDRDGDEGQAAGVKRQLRQAGGSLFGVLTAAGPGILEKIVESVVKTMGSTDPGDELAQGNACQVGRVG